MRRFLRYLRIVFSATCLVACVLLCILWARSYTWGDTLTVRVSQSRVLRMSSGLGVLLVHLEDSQRGAQTIHGWRLQHLSMMKMEQLRARAKVSGIPVEDVKKWGLSA